MNTKEWLEYRKKYLELLYQICSGYSVSNIHTILFPFSLRYSYINLSQRYYSLINNFSDSLRVNSEHNIFKIKLTDLLKALIEIRLNLYKRCDIKIKVVEKVQLRRIDGENIENRSVSNLINEFNQKLNNYLYLSVIQGSVATNDYTLFSDFDTFIILKKNELNSVDKFLKFVILNIKSSRHLYLFDPLQHHRNWIITEEDLSCYDQSNLPLEVLLKSKVISGPTALTFKIADQQNSHLFHFQHAMLSIESKLDTGQYQKNMFFLKDLLSSIMLIPSYLLNLDNIYCYKKDSFGLAKNKFKFSEEEWRVIELASNLRESWERDLNFTHKLLRLISLKILKNPLVYERFTRRYSEKISPHVLSFLEEKKFCEATTIFLKKCKEVQREFVR